MMASALEKDETGFVEERKKWSEHLDQLSRQEQEADKDATLLGDFNGNDFGGWFITGEAFEARTPA